MKNFAERNLNILVLALELGFIDAPKVAAAIQEWGNRECVSIDLVIQELGLIDPEDLAFLQLLLAPRNQSDDGTTKPPGPTGETLPQGGRFRKLEKYAEGGLGAIFYGRDEELGRDVALKQVQEKYANTPGMRERLVREAETTGRLEHPNIVPIYGRGTYTDGEPFYAMRFVRGATLQNAVDAYHDPEFPKAKRNLELRRLLRHFIDVCNALAFAHSRDVLHRDIKPDNLMIGPFGETLVVDWGLAKIPSTGSARSQSLGRSEAFDPLETQDGQGIGAPYYMSPEQAEGRIADIKVPSDIYNLGATLYYILTGQPPFKQENAKRPTKQEYIERVKQGDFPPPRLRKPQVPKPLEAICLKAMALRPENRYQSASDLALEIERWLADEPVDAYPDRWYEKAGRWARKHRTTVAAAIVGLACVTAGLGATSWIVADSNRKISAESTKVNLARANAETNLETARQAVEKMLVQLGRDGLPHIPHLGTVRLDLVQSGLTLYEQLEKQNPSDAWHRRVLSARCDVGVLKRMLGQYDEAIRDFSKSIQELGTSTRIDDLEMLAELEDYSGEANRMKGELADAKAHFDKAVAHAAQVTEMAQGRSRSVFNESRFRLDRAGWLHDVEQPGDALKDYQKATEALRELHRQKPTPHQALVLAMSLDGMAVAQSQVGGKAEVDALFNEAEQILNRLITEEPLNTDFEFVLASTLCDHARHMARDEAHRAAALDRLTQAIATQSRLCSDFPEVAHYETELAIMRRERGIVQLASGRFLDALNDLQSAEEILKRSVQGNRSPITLRDHALTYAALAELAEKQDRRAEAEQFLTQADECLTGKNIDATWFNATIEKIQTLKKRLLPANR